MSNIIRCDNSGRAVRLFPQMEFVDIISQKQKKATEPLGSPANEICGSERRQSQNLEGFALKHPQGFYCQEFASQTATSFSTFS